MLGCFRDPINYPLLGVILLNALIPALYGTLRVHFVNSLPDTWSPSIAAQASWLNISYEVVQEFLLLPLYYIFGKAIADHAGLRVRVTISILVTLAAYAVLTLIVFFGAHWITDAMAQNPDLQAETVKYIRLESLGLLTRAFNDVFLAVAVVLDWKAMLIALVTLRAGFMIAFDTLFLGPYDISLDLGVNGVALTNICTNSLLMLLGLAVLLRMRLIGFSGFSWTTWRESWMWEWTKVAVRSGLESLVRNLAFVWMILKMINEVGEAGLFWTTNAFIWNWLLLPILSLGTLIRQDAGAHDGRLGGRFMCYILLTCGVVVVWGVSIPFWSLFAEEVLKSGEPGHVRDLALIQLFFYVVFAFNNVLDSYFYGVGRTDLMLYQSLLVSILYYGAAFLAYISDLFEPTLNRVALMFGGGILIDSVFTLLLFLWVGHWKKANQPSESLPLADKDNSNPYAPQPSPSASGSDGKVAGASTTAAAGGTVTKIGTAQDKIVGATEVGHNPMDATVVPISQPVQKSEPEPPLPPSAPLPSVSASAAPPMIAVANGHPAA